MFYELKPDQIITSMDDLRWNEAGLIPVIVQSAGDHMVLMQAWMNRQALRDTLRTGLMHYYSRSRRSQWLKGETSGHFQHVQALYADCDSDCLLALVIQEGAACHTGSYSCFFREIEIKG